MLENLYKRNNDKPTVHSHSKVSVKEWSEWSMQPHTEEEIEERIRRVGTDGVCTSFICRYSQMSCSFIERMLALTTGVIGVGTTEQSVQDLTAFMISKLIEPPHPNTEIKLTRYKDGVELVESFKIEDLCDRLDWVYISRFQPLTEDFMLKYAKYLSIKDLKANDNISKSFIHKHKAEFDKVISGIPVGYRDTRSSNIRGIDFEFDDDEGDDVFDNLIIKEREVEGND